MAGFRQGLRAWSVAQPAEWLMLGAFGVFCFVYPFAILLLSLDLMPFGMEWMSSLLLAMLGLSSLGWLWANFGRTGLALGGAVFASGLLLEYIGVLTGVPFGRYSYTGVLVPQLPGGVPLAIGFAWLMIVVSGLFTARRMLGGLGGTLLATFIVSVWGALLVVGLDLLLEPVAYHVKGYWLWSEAASGYYGVPWSNFAAWFVAALAMNIVLSLITGPIARLRWGWLPVALFVMNLIMFGIINVAHRFWLAGLVSLFLIVVVTLGIIRPPGLRKGPPST